MKLARRSGPYRLSLSYVAILALTAFLFGASSYAQAAVTCEKGIGDTEIQCVVKGSSGTHQSLSVATEAGVPVNVLVTQWTGPCAKIENFSRADNVSIPAAKAAAVAVVVPTTAQCASVLFSECKYVGRANGTSVERPFACGELLTVKGAAK